MSDIFNKIQKILSRQFGLKIEQIQPEAKFRDELGADSRDFLEIIEIFEQNFKIKIDPYEACLIVTVQDALKYIEQKIN
jgi:acyl carrier protein|tara:strand:- start:179 stop:415 length:237 start_codon:yes stop_codon:yes gene_type:complete